MAWWVTVDGLVLPRPLAGHPALELVNTRSGWGTPFEPGQEYLRSFDHLVVLALREGLLDGDRAATLRRRARRAPEASRAEVERARLVRADLHGVVLDAATQAARARLASAVAEARGRQRLAISGGGGQWEFPKPTLGDPLDGFLVAAGELLVSQPRVAACPGPDCGWLFLDGSGRRRWCQMAVCGNRAKQAANARRAAAEDAGD